MAYGANFDRHDYSSIDPTEKRLQPAVCCSFTLLAASVMLVIYSRIPFDCKVCPLTGSLVVGIIITALSFSATCVSAIDCYREVKSEHVCLSEKGRNISTSLCATFIALALGIAGTVLVSKICPDLKC